MKRWMCIALMIALCLTLCGCRTVFRLAKSIPDLDIDFAGGNDWSSQNETEIFLQPTEVTQEAKTVTLPHFENQPVDYAVTWLEAEGIQSFVEYDYSNEIAKDLVISQSLSAGTQVTEGMYLTLVVSLGEEECPFAYSQKLTVTASAGNTWGTATLYEWKNGGWQQIAAYYACVGKNGLGAAQEGSRRTPLGVHTLGIVLTSNSVRTSMPVRTVSGSTCVVDDKSSPYYNIIMETYQVPEDTSYDQIGINLTNGTTYATIYIEHNGDGLTTTNVIPGKGSAIGIRGQYGSLKPTYGDVDISYTDMIDLLSRLDVDKHPVIEIVLE